MLNNMTGLEQYNKFCTIFEANIPPKRIDQTFFLVNVNE